MRTLACFVLLVGPFVAAACSGPEAVPDVSENRTAVYEPGSPNFDMEVVSTLSGGRSGIDVYVSIPQESLVFVRSGGGFRASYGIYVTITEDDADLPEYQETWSDTVFVATYEETQSFGRVLLQERIDLAAGEYEAELALEDAESGAQTVRRQTVEVVQRGGGPPAMSEILLRTSRGGGAFEPAVSVHIPGRFDSLQAVTQLHNVRDTANVRLALLRFVSDTTVGTPPHWFTPSHFTLPYIGVDYEKNDTVQVSRRTVLNAESEFSMQFNLPPLEKGVYVAHVHLESGGESVESRRYFTVQSPTFPRISSMGDMVASLTYIAREEEMDHIRSADSQEELKRRFDAFWAERVPNRQAASGLLESYYERVEQANILYSNHKEGWKTDRGMIYIVFGTPAYVENRYTRRDWYYYERGAIIGRAVPPFIFRRAAAYGLAGLFENYILQRSTQHEEEWRRRREDWRDGSVL